MIERSDALMYAVKRSGKNMIQHHVFDPLDNVAEIGGERRVSADELGVRSTPSRETELQRRLG